jgi:hypothetical protein
MDAKITEALRVVELALAEKSPMPTPRNPELHNSIQVLSMRTALQIVRRMLVEHQVQTLADAQNGARHD